MGIHIRYGLEILHQFGKRIKTKSQKVCGANSYVCRSYRGKTSRGAAFILNSVKTSPILGKDSLHVNWKKEIKIWEAFISASEEKRAPSIIMTLTGEAREAMLNVGIEKFTEKTGVNNSMAEIDKMYLKR